MTIKQPIIKKFETKYKDITFPGINKQITFYNGEIKKLSSNGERGQGQKICSMYRGDKSEEINLSQFSAKRME